MPFVKGESGNPGGRPKSKVFREALREEIAASGDDMSQLRKIARVLLDKAEAGDIQAVREIADRLDGKPSQEADISLDALLTMNAPTIDRPPAETREEWLERRKREIAANHH